MIRQPVISSNIKSIGFADGEMHVEFNGGKVFRYTGPKVEEHYNGLMAAESVGKYFYAHVRGCKDTKHEMVNEIPEEGESADAPGKAG